MHITSGLVTSPLSSPCSCPGRFGWAACRDAEAARQTWSSNRKRCVRGRRPSDGEEMQHARLPRASCRFYVHDALDSPSAVRLHSDYTPCNWSHDKFSHQWWLERELRRPNSTWRTEDEMSGAATFLAGHDFPLWCASGTEIFRRRIARRALGLNPVIARDVICPERGPISDKDWPRRYDFDGKGEKISGRWRRRTDKTPYGVYIYARIPLLRKLLDDSRRQGGNLSRPRVMVLTNSECARSWPEGGRPQDVMLLVDYNRARQQLRTAAAASQANRDVIAPFVITSPAWLVGTAPPPPTPPWAERKLLFFAGHIPKLFSGGRTRYLLWKGLRRSEHVTTSSHTLRCSVGAYEICARVNRPRLQTEWQSFCREACNFSAPYNCSKSANDLHMLCKVGRYGALVDWSAERDDIVRDTRRMTRTEYLDNALRHRFCLVAPGDYVSTPKLPETINVGAAGGCLPVFVVDERDGGRSMLPYARWLDYCSIGYVVSSAVVARRHALPAIVQQLLNVTRAEAAAKRRELRRHRAAFAMPSASAFILEELCHVARGGDSAPDDAHLRAQLKRCTLGPDSSTSRMGAHLVVSETALSSTRGAAAANG